MKRIIIFFTAVLILSFLFIGGGREKEGVTINYLATSEIQELMLQDLIPLFEEETGINVEMEMLGHEEGTSKMKLEASKGSDTYDMWCHHSYNHGPFYFNGWVANLDELSEQTGIDLNINDMAGTVELLGQLDGVTYGMPFLLAILGVTQYRADLFDDPAEKKAFKARYGYELGPPKNWSEYADIAEFFTRDTDGDGEIDFWGNNSVLAADGSIYDMWLIRYLGKVVPRDAVPEYNYLFTKELQPRFNSKAGIEAIEDIAELFQKGYTYPGSLSMNWAQIVEPQSNGQSAMAYMWAETILPSMVPENSRYAEVSKWAPIPYDAVPRMEIGGWIQMINAKSKNKEAAFEFLAWCSRPDIEYKLIMETDYWKVPLRAENRKKSEIYGDFDFYTVATDMLDEYEVLRELFLPEIDIVQIAINTELQRVVVGKKDAKTALDDAAKEIVEGFEEAGAFDRVK